MADEKLKTGSEEGAGIQPRFAEPRRGRVPHREPPGMPHRAPLLDTALRVAAVVVFLITTFSILIMGIFASDSDSMTVVIVGLGVIVGGVAMLLLMIIARLAARPFISRGGRSHERSATLVIALIYCIGAPALFFGTWQCVRLFMQAPLYQEASIETPNSIPQF
jgi:hypothetical protein